MVPNARVLALLVVAACGRGPAIFAERVDDGAADDEDTGTRDDLPPECDLDSHTRDCDGDGIPDRDDPFPTDPLRPGRGRTDVIYVHSSSTLSTIDPTEPAGLVVEAVAAFEFPDGPYGQVVDIAIDRFGVMYAIADGVLHACDPTTALCWALDYVSSNSLAFLPEGTIEADDDTLVTLSGSTWTIVELRGPEVTVTAVADVVSPWSSSGDIATTAGGVTAFTSPGQGADVVVSIEPTKGAVVGPLGVVQGSTGIYGVAAVGGLLWLFDQTGSMWTMDPATGEAVAIGFDPQGFWGATAHASLR